ncbi:Ubiquitin carboxyl-terminal hydrolase bap1 [Allomyces arbusculus]|nr:Ubiquitin carboxyl-terminal hydrolase bap1 [Allomyces arbusculus]
MPAINSSWCTIESNPAVFWQIILGFGVRGFWFREVYVRTGEYFLQHHLPSLAVIFCFPLVDAVSAAEVHEFHGPNPPASLFFANQVINNACASQAILHAMLNLTAMPNGCALGDLLTMFKDFTSAMSPSIRGVCISNSPPLHRVHNSFGRLPFCSELGKFGQDLVNKQALDAATEAEKAAKRQAKKQLAPKSAKRKAKKPKSKGRRRGNYYDGDSTGDELSDVLMSDVEESTPTTKTATAATETAAEEEAPCAVLDDHAFHYTAFMPYEGHVWELDGLLPRPKYIGPIPEGETWHKIVMEHIDLRMLQYEDNEQRCNVMSLEVDPLLKASAKVIETEQLIEAMRNGTAPLVPSPPPVPAATTASAEPAAKRARKGQQDVIAEPMDVDVDVPTARDPEPAVVTASSSSSVVSPPQPEPQPQPMPERDQDSTPSGRPRRNAARAAAAKKRKVPTPDPEPVAPPPPPPPPPTVEELEEQVRQMKVTNDGVLAEREAAKLEIERGRFNYIPFIGTVFEKLFEADPKATLELAEQFTEG